MLGSGGAASGQNPAVDGQRGPRDPASLLACQEQDRLDDVLGLPVPNDRVEIRKL
jgi:hypothetical protein